MLKDIIESAGLLDDFIETLTDDDVDPSTAFTDEITVCCEFDNDAYTYTEDDGTIDPFYGSISRLLYESVTESEEVTTTVIQGYDEEGNPVD